MMWSRDRHLWLVTIRDGIETSHSVDLIGQKLSLNMLKSRGDAARVGLPSPLPKLVISRSIRGASVPVHILWGQEQLAVMQVSSVPVLIGRDVVEVGRLRDHSLIVTVEGQAAL